MKKVPLTIRFEDRVNLDGPVPAHRSELGPCHVWTGNSIESGYGTMYIDPRHKMVYAHRIAWFVHFGEWPSDCVLHHCDNPPCVRIDHLFEGTIGDNNRDMFAKGRHGRLRATGEAHWKAKLTEELVRTCRAAHANGAAIRALAREHGVSMYCMWAAVNGATWRSVGP